MVAFYNEFDPAAAHILRAMIDNGVIAPGIVDTRSIKELTPDDVAGFTQVHLFAGGGLWSVAARLAGWPDDAPLWTGSCPCQPFSAAGKGLGTDDPRHLWPDFHRLIRACRPAVVMGEQVAGKAGYGWFDGVCSDLENEGFPSRTVDFPACSVDAPHQRNRQYWAALNVVDAASYGWGEGWPEHEFRRWRPTIAGADAPSVTQGDAIRSGLEGQRGHGDGSRGQEPDRPVTAADGGECRIPSNPALALVQGQPPAGHEPDAGEDEGVLADYGREPRRTRPSDPEDRAFGANIHGAGRNGTYWSDAHWIECHDGKARRAQSGIRFLVDGLPGRVDLWRVGGNAIVPEAAAEVIAAFMDVYGVPAIIDLREAA